MMMICAVGLLLALTVAASAQKVTETFEPLFEPPAF
jgi:hypothetical protein